MMDLIACGATPAKPLESPNEQTKAYDVLLRNLRKKSQKLGFEVRAQILDPLGGSDIWAIF